MLEIVVEYLGVIALVASLIGLFFGINKFMKSKSHESDLLKYLALATSIVIGLVNIVAIFEAYVDTVPPDVTVHWLTIVLIFLAGMTMLADPLKDTPLAAAIAMITMGALAGLLILFGDLDGVSNVDLFGIIIPLWLIILSCVLIVGLVFIASLFTEFAADRILQIISWSPIVIAFNACLFLQALLMIVLNDTAGIWSLLSP
ncbi:MAG: hypothetical protein KAT16_07750 [Candidatus Heimdallarchaeota archaeon]|nr:hypothetical protein [Candidatus Heimdallarchaeota archaeon]